MIKKLRKNDILWMQLGVLVIATLAFSALFLSQLNILNGVYDDLTKIEYLSSSTQRLARLALADQADEKLLFYIDEQMKLYIEPEQDTSLSVLEKDEFIEYSEGIITSWNQIDELIREETIDVTSLYLATDNHFYQMTDLAGAVNDYAEEVHNRVAIYQAVITILFGIIGLIILNNVLSTHTELRQSKQLAQTALIDLATGLYNRSKCQELFKIHAKMSERNQQAIVVLDLNDLKKTNDELGHRVGDELIYTFAHMLKTACNVHMVPPFVGRYGGDEFIIFYENVEHENEIEMYIKELEFLVKDFNEKQHKFQISYAAGYACMKIDTAEELTLRQLFDQADAAMYENKIAGKRAKNPNYDAEAAKGGIR